VYFGDLRGNVYALDAATGRALWIVSADPHPLAAVTGSPSAQGTSLRPLARARARAAVRLPLLHLPRQHRPLDADTGKQAWKTFIIGEERSRRRRTRARAAVRASGGGIWATPT